MPQSCTAVILSPCGEEIHRDDWQNECFRTSHVYLYSGLPHSIFLSCFCLFFYLSPLLSVLFYLVTLPLYTILSDLSKWAGNLFPFVWGFVSPCLSLTEAGVLSEVLQEPLALFFLVPTATTRAPGRDGKVSGSGVHVVGGHVSSCVQRNTQTERGTVNKPGHVLTHLKLSITWSIYLIYLQQMHLLAFVALFWYRCHVIRLSDYMLLWLACVWKPCISPLTNEADICGKAGLVVFIRTAVGQLLDRCHLTVFVEVCQSGPSHKHKSKDCEYIINILLITHFPNWINRSLYLKHNVKEILVWSIMHMSISPVLPEAQYRTRLRKSVTVFGFGFF